MRIGYGYDSHRFAEGRKLVLGGVVFPGEAGLKGHSDADVLIHAIVDALLGAAALGDIGSHFPDTDPQWKDADSAKLLTAVAEEVRAAGYSVSNIDATVICEKPKIGPKVDEIKARLSQHLNISTSRLSLKGKTNEKMDDVGAGLGVEVHAVALLEETGEG